MSRNISFQEAERYGFVFPGAREWITPENMPKIAQDAALITTPNTTVPAYLSAYIDPKVVEILTAPRKAREIFDEVKKGDWATPFAQFHMMEMTGVTEPYSDYGQAGTSGVNYEWAYRKQYIFQTLIQYGDLEQAVTAAAKINIAADKQRSAANIIDVEANRFDLLGVAGLEIYGALNDPNLLAAITPIPVTPPGGSTTSVKWADKSTKQIYEDVLKLYRQLVSQAGGWIDQDTLLTLAMSPELSVYLGTATDFNVSVQDMLNRYFRNLRIVTLPELSSATAGETMMMIAREVQGQRTGELAFGEKIRAGRIVPDVSSYKQKYSSSTYGAIIYLPFAIAQMTGM